MPRRSQPVLTLTAAAKRINMADPQAAKRDAAKSKPWHAEAWGYFDEVPEIKESIRYRGNQLGKVRLFVAVANPKDPTADPVPVTDPDSGVPPSVATAAVEELARLRSRMGGQAEIMRMLDMNLEVVGEAYLIGYSERTEQIIDPVTNVPRTEVTQPEDWMIRSVSEVEVKGSGASTKYIVKADPNDTKGVELDRDRDTIMRIWLRHPQWASQADCAMRGLLGECRQLQVLCQQQLAHSYRALSAGILTVPNELMPVGPPDPTKPEEVEDPLMDVLYEVLTAPIADPTHPSTVQPGLLRGPSAQLGPDVLRLIKFYDAEQVKDIEARIEARIARIARGLNLPVEKIMGHQQTTYANAAQVDEDEFNDYLAPSAETAVEALTFAFLTPQLEEAGGEAAAWADRLFVWYDPSDLIAQPDAEAHAKEAHEAGVISDAASRRAWGFGEDDAPEPEELLIRTALKNGRLSADVTLALLKMLGVPLDVTPGAAGTDPNQPAVTGSMVRRILAPIRAASRPSSPDYGRRLTEIDRELRSRLLVASNVAMGHALDRAANRLRTKTNGSPLRASLNSVSRRSWFAQLGPSLVAEAMGDEDPLEGAWDGLEGDFRAWGGDAQARARMTAGQAVGGDLSGLEPQQADDLDSAWLWFAASLTGLATARLWTPDPSAPDIGEHDPTVMIPAGMVRQAVARAGGAQGLITGGQDAWVTLTDAGTRPAGGIGTGDLIRGALRDGGASIEGYVWRYGPGFRQRPFEPHMALEGVQFENFDDDVLASQGEFGFAFYIPGDHSGCLCDFEPDVVPPGAGQRSDSNADSGSDIEEEVANSPDMTRSVSNAQKEATGATRLDKDSMESFVSKYDSLSEDQRSAAEWYSGSGFSDVNSSLRAGDMARNGETVSALDSAMQPTPNSLVVNRSLDSFDAFGARSAQDMEGLVGAVIKDDAYLSTSMVGKYSGLSPVNMEITVPAGTPSLPVSKVSLNPTESELLLGRGTKLAITEVSKDKFGFFILKATVVP